ncbi:MAG: penicillin-binding transpeptidase domain-containing protein, partial [Patescibacteria group bacterium]
IPYGSTAYGVESASRVYFGKDVQDVTLGEAAILAALPQAPTYYSPWGNHKDALIARQHTILNAMVEQHYITKEQAENAKKETLTFKDPGTNIDAPHFVMYVKELLAKEYDEKTIEQGGLKVITSLDFDKQTIAEEVVDKRAKENLNQGATNAAMISLDAKTGEILAMVGSKDYFDKDIDGNVNVVLRKRQPGSSFKPIVYAAALMKGFTPQTTIYDVITNFSASGEAYIPKNFTNKEYGPVTLKKALAGSLNITAVKVLYLTGIDTVSTLAKDLGYTSLNDPQRYGLTLVLGGGEVTLLEHASAYTAFAREGERAEPIAILKIEDRHGKVLQEFKDPKVNRVFDEEIARQMNDMLSDNNARSYIFGANNLLTLSGRPVAAKTGTTNDVRDAWTIGYTPSVVTGVWVGNNDNTSMKKNGSASMLS